MAVLLKCLNSFAKVSDLKFSNEEKSAAFAKFILFQACPLEQAELLLSTYGRYGTVCVPQEVQPDTPIKYFELKPKSV